MEQTHQEILYHYKELICSMFHEEIEILAASSSIGPMGQFQIKFFYKPAKLYITLDADRGLFSLDIEDKAKDWNTLYRIQNFDNKMAEECLEKALVILKQVLEKNEFPLYKSENNKLYKKQNGVYRRIKDTYAELNGFF